MEKSITSIMLREHEKIKNLLEKVQNELKINIQNSEMIFREFKWILDKHFFVEEKVIFTIFDSSNEEENIEMLNLLKEHKDILFLIKKIEEHFLKDIKPDMDKLKNDLLAHAKFENEVFYPRLEDELDEKQKCLIIERCKDMIRE
jgi:hemerythrin-like domain-containing protein